MKKLKFHFILLVLLLISIQTISAQTIAQIIKNDHLTMVITGYESPQNPKLYCFDIEVNPLSPLAHNNGVTVSSDLLGNNHTFTDSGTVTWCYQRNCLPQDLWIDCRIIKAGSLLFRDGCVVVIEPLRRGAVLNRPKRK